MSLNLKPKRHEKLFNMRSKKQIFNIWEHREWGNSINWIDYEKRSLYGFVRNKRVKINDEFRDKMKSGKIMRYKVIKLEYKLDPSDMFFATVKDIEYL